MIDKQVGLLPMGVHLSACAMFLWPHFPLKGLCIPPSPRFNWARWLRSVDEWRQVRCSASTLDMDVLMVSSHFAVPADREDGCLPAVPQHFVQNAHSADGSGCLRWGRDQHQWVPCWWPWAWNDLHQFLKWHCFCLLLSRWNSQVNDLTPPKGFGWFLSFPCSHFAQS